MNQARPIPLKDQAGVHFTYAIVDPLPETLHDIDFSTGGSLGTIQQVTNPENRDQYIVRSLIEEAITSSQLEGAATTREVASDMIRQGRPPRDVSERMVLNNYRTMERIRSVRGESLSRDLVFELHRMVTTDTLKDPSAAGRFRSGDEDVSVQDPEGQILHQPPPADGLEGRLEMMCAFANGTNSEEFVHPAIRAMVLHFWLAYDHPFVDGNGRTARALFYWSMLNAGYWLFEYVSVSHVILKAPVKYGRAFLETESDDNDLTYFLLYHADVVRKAVRVLDEYMVERTRRLHSLQARLRGMAGFNARQRELIGHALRHPGQIYTVESHRVSHQVVYETSRADLLDLAGRGILDKRKQGKTYVFTAAPDLERKLAR